MLPSLRAQAKGGTHHAQASQALSSQGGMGRRRGRGGNISCPSQITKHSQNSWADNPHVLLQASATLVSLLTRSCSSHHQEITQRKPHGLPARFYACWPQDTRYSLLDSCSLRSHRPYPGLQE